MLRDPYFEKHPGELVNSFDQPNHAPNVRAPAANAAKRRRKQSAARGPHPEHRKQWLMDLTMMKAD